MQKLTWQIISLWLCAQPLLAAPSAATSWQNIEYIERAFIEVALKNEYRQTDMKLVKWVAPIQYQFTYLGLPKNPFIENLTVTHLKQLHTITRHPITHVRTGHAPNLQIIFTKDQHYQEAIQRYIQKESKALSRDSNCSASFQLNQQHEIINANVVIPIDYVMSRGLLPACIVEETTQVMGLPNDSDWVFPSIANDKSKLDLLTGLDYILLKLLYSPDLKPGMDRQQIHPILQHLLYQWKTSNLIQGASKKVKESGLYPLIY
ncbi:hypothetical protein GHNINEIG_00337 [Hydrogenovibrio crunogenus]|uniref:DUF2927 domain-containing protein n=1 Tax=Hydrogenovibrio crunogenus TaxID=39765 RepID=A0A4P7NXR2_9GAMM|nr:DUF2927 domain-containing protein [Hydrogenovibrio crunogenus]QBZ82309.1 hypothetical protein GHNINEIG_00337 [Hydrogenovibrio crunogenus]